MNPTLLAFDHARLMLATNHAWQETVKWMATIFMTLSAMTVSFSVSLSASAFVFSGFLLGHILWGLSAYAMREKALLALNVGFIPIDIYAIWIRL